MKTLTILALALSLAAAADAQTVVRPAARLAAPNAAVQQIDPVMVLQSRMTRLEHKVSALEATLGKTQPALTFACADNVTSRNSVGVFEDCRPFACAAIDGRCRTVAKTTDDCAPGNQWVSGGDCVP